MVIWSTTETRHSEPLKRLEEYRLFSTSGPSSKVHCVSARVRVMSISTSEDVLCADVPVPSIFDRADLCASVSKYSQGARQLECEGVLCSEWEDSVCVCVDMLVWDVWDIKATAWLVFVLKWCPLCTRYSLMGASDVSRAFLCLGFKCIQHTNCFHPHLDHVGQQMEPMF